MEELQAKFAELQQQNTVLQSQLTALLSKINNQKAESVHVVDSVPEVSAVSPKLPPFWVDRPNHWFRRVEAQFNLAGIKSEQTKFDYIIANLDSRLIAEVEDIVSNPPDQGQYEKLKTELTRRLSMSECQRVRQLISEEELNGRKPSQFLRHLRSLAGDDLKDDGIIKELWMRRLPQFLQAILTAQSDLCLDKLAHLADSILEVSPGTITTNAVFASTSNSPASKNDLTTRVEELTKQVAALTAAAGHRGRSRSRRGRSRFSAQRSRSPSANTNKVCWYHKKYDTKALKCIKPCSWAGKATDSQ
ncbi:hypothetical protein HF086_005197 [Spodoptera exigua]|uniref:DUF7041 domain-containing protein n=1 Tax=Spodoptera exigua TaxID=7107 RepID=A0A922MJY7_SPOEX|nr:hypothetical protein HF086_005197 [Spodoptera exigua]